MLRTRFGMLVLVSALVGAGCGGTLKFDEGDGSVDDTATDGPGDTSMDTDHDPGVDPGTDPVPDPGTDPGVDPGVDPVVDTAPDPTLDTGVDPGTDPVGPQCDDGLDNDGDDLIDTEDWDCADASSPVEGPPPGPVECSVDTHCDIGYEECDRDTGTCVAPVEGELCDPCSWRGDCGGGSTDEEDPDVDWCVYSGSSGGNCSKDCVGDFDCPKGFVCDMGEDGMPPGMCWPFVGSCGYFEVIGQPCGTDEDCYGITCLDGMCTYGCEAEFHCIFGYSCVESHCIPD